jgi:hypothetical protein
MRSVSVGCKPAITSSSSKQPGTGSERAGDLKPFAIRQGERRSDAVIAFAEQFEALEHFACARVPRRADMAFRCCNAPTMTLSSTLSAGNGRTIWKLRAMPRRHTACRRSNRRSVRRRKLIAPSSGRHARRQSC